MEIVEEQSDARGKSRMSEAEVGKNANDFGYLDLLDVKANFPSQDFWQGLCRWTLIGYVE